MLGCFTAHVARPKNPPKNQWRNGAAWAFQNISLTAPGRLNFLKNLDAKNWTAREALGVALAPTFVH